MSNPTNLINQNLVIGGNLGVVGNLAVDGVTAAIGNVAVVGNVLATGQIGSGTAIGVVTPTAGFYKLDYVEQLVTLATGVPTTTITFPTGSLPAGVSAVAATVYVVSSITGLIGTTAGTLILNPTSAATPTAAISTFVAGDKGQLLAPAFLQIVDADTAEFTLSGGVDNNPSGGSIRVAIYFWRVSESSS